MAKTGVSKFRFVSPGVQVAEIDNSQIPKEAEPVGPVIIGRAMRGPGLRPIRVDSYSDFVEIFGNASPGVTPEDIWRNGGEGLAPTYGVYAAQAWFKNSTPVTFVRLLGKAHTDATTAGKAGWQVGTSYSDYGTGGAFGLFLINSGSAAGGLKAVHTTGTLAAVFYCNNGAVSLTGSLFGPERETSEASGGLCIPILSNGTNKQFTAMIYSGSSPTAGAGEKITFDFNKDSKRYIRKVFNTNPTLVTQTGGDTNHQYDTSAKNYFLGETFDRSVAEFITNTGDTSSRIMGVCVPLLGDSTDWNINRASLARASSGWVIGQDLGDSGSFNAETAQTLFRFKSLEGGEWEQKNLKVSIKDVKAPVNQFSPWGSFTVEVRMARDSDEDPIPVETFTNCTLNKESPDYIAAKIGDSYVDWSDTDRRYREYGDYPNRSAYVYVTMNNNIPNPSQFVPFGYRGPLRFLGFQSTGSGAACFLPDNGTVGTANSSAMVTKGDNANTVVSASITSSFQFPRTYLRPDTAVGNLTSPKEAYFGLDTTYSGSSTVFDPSYQDYVLGLPDNYRTDGDQGEDTPTANTTEYSYIFTLDDVSRYSGSVSTTVPKTSSVDAGTITNQTGVGSAAFYLSGSRKLGVSLSSTGSNTYKSTIDAGFDQFTMPLFGGFNGVNILERNPFNNSTYGTSGKTELTSYAYNSIKLAVDACADPEVVECNMMTAPGVTTEGLTNHIMDVCERRADSLAVIDIAGNFTPRDDRSSYVSSDSDSTVRGSVSTAVSTLNNRALNNSYATAYYPWVKVKDQGTGMNVWVPPSVVAVGTYANTDSNFELWFAPAGFTRGGLSEGAAGIPVLGLKQRLTSKDRDQLYEANINPIAQFPAEGIVMFGQKTLQSTRSALDRVNVRRLMIHVKREISRIASRLLFDQNVSTTWARFKGQVVPFLDSVRLRHGLDDYRVILDATTTTPDLIDRNIMYAKIFLKPARAIEFIAIDFVITNSGAAFED